MLSSVAVTTLLSIPAFAIPTPLNLFKRQDAFEIVEQLPWNAGAVTEFRIHQSCNASQAFQLRQGLSEAIELAQHAKDHVNRYGSTSDIYRKYFGVSALSTDVIGAFDIIVNGNKAESLFRCDDPDGNCELMPSGYCHVSFVYQTVLTATSLGRSLPWQQCFARDRHLSDLLLRTPSTVYPVCSGLQCARVLSAAFLGF